MGTAVVSTDKKLNSRQQRFVEEYLLDLNATQAAIRAGYSPRTAEVQGSRLLSDAKVQRATAAGMAAHSKRTEVTADRALLQIARLGFSDLRRHFDEDGRLKHPTNGMTTLPHRSPRSRS